MSSNFLGSCFNTRTFKCRVIKLFCSYCNCFRCFWGRGRRLRHHEVVIDGYHWIRIKMANLVWLVMDVLLTHSCALFRISKAISYRWYLNLFFCVLFSEAFDNQCCVSIRRSLTMKLPPHGGNLLRCHTELRAHDLFLLERVIINFSQAILGAETGICCATHLCFAISTAFIVILGCRHARHLITYSVLRYMMSFTTCQIIFLTGYAKDYIPTAEPLR